MSGIKAAFVEKPCDEGLSKADIYALVAMIDDGEYIPMEIENIQSESTAMGFVSRSYMDEEFDYDPARLIEYVQGLIALPPKPGELRTFGELDGGTIFVGYGSAAER